MRKTSFGMRKEKRGVRESIKKGTAHRLTDSSL
jgi:hypothetical protein